MHDIGDILFCASERAPPICGCGVCAGIDEYSHRWLFAGGLSLSKCGLCRKLGHIGVRSGTIGALGMVCRAIRTINGHRKAEMDPRCWPVFSRAGPRCHRLRRCPNSYFGRHADGFVFGNGGAVVNLKCRQALSIAHWRYWHCGGHCLAAANEPPSRGRTASGGILGSKQGYGCDFGAWNAVLYRVPHHPGCYHARGIYARQVRCGGSARVGSGACRLCRGPVGNCADTLRGGEFSVDR